MGYTTDLTDTQWELIEEYFEIKRGKNLQLHSKRALHAANIHDTMSGCHVYQAAKNKYPSIKGGCADEGYRGTFVKFVKVKYEEVIDISEKIKPKQWHILPKRWRVERTFGWANWSRILSKDYEIKALYQENAFMVSHLHTLLKRY